MAEADPIEAIKTMLSSGWTAANTDNITPAFWAQGDHPPRLEFMANGAIIKVYNPDHQSRPNDQGPNYSVAIADRIVIDIRTKRSRAHLRNVYNEARRIFGVNTNDPAAGWQLLTTESFEDKSMAAFYWYQFYVLLQNWTTSKT